MEYEEENTIEKQILKRLSELEQNKKFNVTTQIQEFCDCENRCSKCGRKKRNPSYNSFGGNDMGADTIQYG